jgi:hypothetical protein
MTLEAFFTVFVRTRPTTQIIHHVSTTILATVTLQFETRTFDCFFKFQIDITMGANKKKRKRSMLMELIERLKTDEDASKL